MKRCHRTPQTVGFWRSGLCLSLSLAGENEDMLSTGLSTNVHSAGWGRQAEQAVARWAGTFELDHHESGAGSRCPERKQQGKGWEVGRAWRLGGSGKAWPARRSEGQRDGESSGIWSPERQ